MDEIEIIHENSAAFRRDFCYTLFVFYAILEIKFFENVPIYKLGLYALREGDADMVTQIAPTPVVKGTEAVKIYKEADQKRSQVSKNGAEKLRNEDNT